jgi:hypothetical protein
MALFGAGFLTGFVVGKSVCSLTAPFDSQSDGCQLPPNRVFC